MPNRRELAQTARADAARCASACAIAWPDGSDHVRWRSRLRCGSEVGASPLAMAPSGRLKSGVEILVSITFGGRTLAVWAPPKSKKVCQPMNRRRARAPPRRSTGSACPSPAGSKMKPKNGGRRRRQPGWRDTTAGPCCDRSGRPRLETPPDALLPAPRGVEAAPARQDVAHQRGAEDLRQELVDDDPLIVPGDHAGGPWRIRCAARRPRVSRRASR